MRRSAVELQRVRIELDRLRERIQFEVINRHAAAGFLRRLVADPMDAAALDAARTYLIETWQDEEP